MDQTAALMIGDTWDDKQYKAASLNYPTRDGALSSGLLNASGRGAINKTGTTQLRVYFNAGDNDDGDADYLGFYSGENGTSSNRPVLEVTYH